MESGDTIIHQPGDKLCRGFRFNVIIEISIPESFSRVTGTMITQFDYSPCGLEVFYDSPDQVQSIGGTLQNMQLAEVEQIDEDIHVKAEIVDHGVALNQSTLSTPESPGVDGIGISNYRALASVIIQDCTDLK
jgi:hypothetical protein